MAYGDRKTEAVNLRMTPAIKELLRQAAAKERRTLSNMLEVLIVEHCDKSGIATPADDVPVEVAPPTEAVKRKRSRRPAGQG